MLIFPTSLITMVVMGAMVVFVIFSGIALIVPGVEFLDNISILIILLLGIVAEILFRLFVADNYAYIVAAVDSCAVAFPSFASVAFKDLLIAINPLYERCNFIFGDV